MIKTKKHWLISGAILLSWSFFVFLSLFWNTRIAITPQEIDKVMIIHISLWIVGLFLSLPLISLLLKQASKLSQLSSNKSNYFLLFNSINTPIFLFDKRGGALVFANNSAREHFEITEIGKNKLEAEQLKCLVDELKKYSNSIIKKVKLEQNCTFNDSGILNYEATLNDILINNSYATLVVLNDSADNEKNLQEINDYIEDLHAKEDVLEDNAFELIQLNIKLEESETNLREANANKDKFFSIVAHDLKSPFVGLLGITEMLDTDYDGFEEKERREFIHSLYEISKNTFELLEGLLDWARVKQGRMDYNPKEFDLFKLADSLVNLLKANAFKKEIELKNSININTLVFGDREMVSTVLRNLLANAIKFTPKAGIIEIKAEYENDSIKISVIDSGVGISEKNQDKLFRIDVNHTTLGTNDEKGTGLGLILCKELIEKHGTDIWVESEIGKGSSFIFTLPLEKALV